MGSVRTAAVLAAAALVASGRGADLEAAGRASAECGHAVHDELGLAEDDTDELCGLRVTEVAVERLPQPQ